MTNLNPSTFPGGALELRAGGGHGQPDPGRFQPEAPAAAGTPQPRGRPPGGARCIADTPRRGEGGSGRLGARHPRGAGPRPCERGVAAVRNPPPLSHNPPQRVGPASGPRYRRAPPSSAGRALAEPRTERPERLPSPHSRLPTPGERGPAPFPRAWARREPARVSPAAEEARSRAPFTERLKALPASRSLPPLQRRPPAARSTCFLSGFSPALR